MELVLENVAFSYDRGLPTETVVLASVSLRVKEGELLSIVGRTGSGKTTLGLIMAGLVGPTGGTVRFDESPRPLPHASSESGGMVVSKDVVTPKGVGASKGSKGVPVAMVFQFPESQFFEEDVFSEVAFGPSRLGLGRDEVRLRAVAAMEKVGLDARALSSRSPLGLSEGEKRRVAIASALACGPRFLVLDEPTVSLDWEASSRIFEVLDELRQRGICLIVMTHEVDEAVAYSDRIAVLAEGKLVADGRLGKDEVSLILSERGARRAS